jgi:hypothetical protein
MESRLISILTPILMRRRGMSENDVVFVYRHGLSIGFLSKIPLLFGLFSAVGTVVTCVEATDTL